MATIPVLMYHHVNPNSGDMITITPGDFEAHLRSIKEGGYRTLTLDELRGFMDGSFTSEEKAVVITFDDAYLDNFVYAFPLLKKFGLRAVIFTVTGWLDKAGDSPLDKEGMAAFKQNPPTHNRAKVLVEEGRHNEVIMDWAMARTMRESGLIEFASHTVSHRDCDRLNEKELAIELGDSKKRLLEELGVSCDYLCWPRGRFSDEAVKIAAKLGYRACFTTEHGVVRERSDPMYINRIVVKEGPEWVKKRLAIYTNPILCRLYLSVKGGGAKKGRA